MSFTENFLKELEKKKKQTDNSDSSFTENFLNELEKKKKAAEEADTKSQAKSIGGALSGARAGAVTGVKELLESRQGQGGQIVVPVSYRDTRSEYGGDLIAPIIKPIEEERTWFTKGAFENGYQFGDVTKTILGTGRDIGENLVSGGIGLLEQLIDLSLYGRGIDAKVGESIGESIGKAIAKNRGGDYASNANKMSEQIREVIAKDLIDEEAVTKRILKVTDPLRWGHDTFDDVDELSILGERIDSIAQSGGQLAVQAGLQGVGVPWWVTSAISSSGSQLDEAFSNDASYEEAGLSTAISTIAEIGTEKLFGGSGLGEKGLINTEWFTKNVSNKVVKLLLDYGIDILGEGGEEVVSQIFSNLGSALYRDDETLYDIMLGKEARESYLESFVGGTLLSIFGSGGKISNALNIYKGEDGKYHRGEMKDYHSNLTEAESKVVDKVAQNRIAEKESNGKKLTGKQKSDIREKAMSELESGGISIEVIEEALGGDTYTNYKNATESKQALLDEYAELGKVKDSEATIEQKERRAEIKAQIEKMNKYSLDEALEKQLHNEVWSKAQGTKLEESFNERARRGEDFTFDESTIDKKYRDTYKRAAESGILNNTRKTHQFVDFIARISSDKGVSFDFTNDEKLKASGFAVEGKIVNGIVSADGSTIGINVESSKALNSIVGHEVTHILEGTELYEPFAKLMEDFATAKGEYQTRFDRLAKLYEGVEGYEGDPAEIDAKIKKEVIADLVGDYLFTDSKFVERLSITNRNVFEKIFDEIKYLCRTVTAGSAEARKLEQVKHTFEKVYRQETQKNTTDKGGTRYSLTGKNIYGIEVYETSQNIMNLTWNERKAKYLDMMKNEYQGRTAKFVRNGHTYYASFDSNSLRKPIYGDSRSSTDGVKALIKAGADGDVFELVEDSEYTGSKPNSKNHTDADYFDYFVKTVQIDGKVFDLIADVEKKYGQNGGFVYTLALRDNNKIKALPAHSSNVEPVKSAGNASVYSISKNSEDVNRKAAQFEIILQNNPATDSYHTWIRSAEDIKTFEETLSDEDWSDGSDFDPDYTWDMAQKALKSGEITVYSSYPIEAGVFVTPSAMEAKSYSGSGRIYSKTVKLTDVAWIDPTQGMFAEVKEGARYSLSEQFYNEYDAWDKTNPRKVFTIGNTSEVLKSLGVKDTEIKWDASKIIKIKANHPEMTDEIIKQVPSIIESPIVVFRSLQSDSRLTMFGEVYADGKPILAVLELDPTGRNGASLDEIKIASAYGKDNAQSFINRSEVLYLDSNEKRISDWEKRTGLQLPVGLSITDSINSISKNSADVNSKLSLFETGSDIAPVSGDLHIYGKDIRKQSADDDIVPIREDIIPVRENISSVAETEISKLEQEEAGLKAELERIEQAGIEAQGDYKLMSKLIDEHTAVSNKLAEVTKALREMRQESNKVRAEAEAGDAGQDYPTRRKEYHAQIIDGIKQTFASKGYDFDKVLNSAKNLPTLATVDNTPQRVMEKALGYRAGGILSDITVNKVAQNETEGIKWLNSYTNRKNGVLAKLSQKYNIKPGSKQSAAAQMYAEGFYVDDNNNIVEYGDSELAKDFPNAEDQKNIKGIAKDPIIRRIYDETLDRINESRVRNAYEAIPRLDNYYLHFRAMNDTFSRLGVPFNPNDIRAKDLPTDLNGVTADLKPGQPYFASAMHRNGKRTDFDLLVGLERYLTSAKNQIYHIDDIQTLRALRNYIADTFGQANGLGDLDALSDAEAQERIEQVYSSHLSTFAKFLNEEANVIAGKTALIDRGLEGIIGRRGITFFDDINKQVGSNMVGFNLSSSLTNFLPVAQTFAKSSKTAFVKAFGQTVANRIGSIYGRGDNFAENSPVMIRREGAQRFYRTPWQKAGDMGYVLMGAVDSISTELIARTKYNEFVKKGMSSEKAHYETDKWVSRLMGDRSLGQMPQLYNSKMLGVITKFQLEVRNQLDAQFYDTIQEAKASNEYIKNGLLRNAKTAAKVASTFVQLAVAQHLFGKAFESVAGYNPAFDIIEVIATAFGWDDEEDSEDTALDNIEQAFFALLEDLPYTSTLTGGRIPMASALPIEELINGVDKYGNEKSRWETAGEALPYYLLPGGYGQIKKSVQGLKMFDNDIPIAGSYTDSGKLRFPVEDNLESMFQAGLFGQWSSKNAREYFDEGRSALTPEQTQEFIDSGMSIHDYWEYREGLKGLKTVEEKFDYIDSLNISLAQKNLLVNNLVDRKTPVDMTDYGNYADYDEFTFAESNPDKYSFLKENGISYDQYNSSNESKEAYNWAFKYPEKYAVSKAISDNLIEFKEYDKYLNSIKAGDETKARKKEYIFSLDIEYGRQLLLFKNEYPKDDTYNYEIIDYLNSRSDISEEQEAAILRELGFTIEADGTVTWD